MTATPDSFSMADLQAMLESAPLDITDQDTPISRDKKSWIIELAETTLQNAVEPLDGGEAALLHKVMLHTLVDHMIEWHSTVAAHAAEQGEIGASIGWARDAGKFQAIANALETIEVGPDDFTCTVRK